MLYSNFYAVNRTRWFSSTNRNHKKARVKRAFEIGTTEWIDNFSLRAVVTCCAGSSQASCLKCYAFYRTAVVLTHPIAPIKKPAEAGLIIGTTEWIDPTSTLGLVAPPSVSQRRLRLRLVLNCYAVNRTRWFSSTNRNHKKARVKRAFEIGTTEWIRTTDPYHVKVVL